MTRTLPASALALLLALPAHAAGYFSVTCTPDTLNFDGAACDSVRASNYHRVVTPVTLEVRWEGALGRDSFVRLGCLRGVPQRLACTTVAPGFYKVQVRLQSAEGVSCCWSRPVYAIAYGWRR